MTTGFKDSGELRRGVIIGLHVAALVAGMFGTVYARQSVKFASVDMVVEITDDTVYLPSDEVLQLSSLGYGPFGSDLVFIRTHAYFLRHMYSDRIFRWLDPYVGAAVALDPDNRDIYNWAATVVRYGQSIDREVVERSNRFAEMGIERFPDDPRLYAHLGFNKYFELRPMLMDREQELRSLIEAAKDAAEGRRLLAELTEVKAGRYALEQEALIDYSMAAMLPNSTVDPVFLATLYIKHDEAAAAAQAIASLYGSASSNDQEQLLARLRIMGRAQLAGKLEEARREHAEDMEYVPEGLYGLLAREADLRVPERWDSTGFVLDHARKAIEDKERELP